MQKRKRSDSKKKDKTRTNHRLVLATISSLLSREKVFFFAFATFLFLTSFRQTLNLNRLKLFWCRFYVERERDIQNCLRARHTVGDECSGKIQDIQSVIKNANAFCVEINQLVLAWLGHKFKLNLSTTVVVIVADQTKCAIDTHG